MSNAKLILIALLVSSLVFVQGCGGSDEGSSETPSDSVSSQEDGTLRDAAQDILDPVQPPSGAQGLINEAQSVTDQANERADELQEMMGDM